MLAEGWCGGDYLRVLFPTEMHTGRGGAYASARVRRLEIVKAGEMAIFTMSEFSRSVTKCLPQKSPSLIVGRNGPLSGPTPAVQIWRREPLNLPDTVR